MSIKNIKIFPLYLSPMYDGQIIQVGASVVSLDGEYYAVTIRHDRSGTITEAEREVTGPFKSREDAEDQIGFVVSHDGQPQHISFSCAVDMARKAGFALSIDIYSMTVNILGQDVDILSQDIYEEVRRVIRRSVESRIQSLTEDMAQSTCRELLSYEPCQCDNCRLSREISGEISRLKQIME